MHVEQIISTHPQVRGAVDSALIRCVEECYDCSQTCTACADACLGEPSVQALIQCIRDCVDCADVCLATGQIASRRTGSNEPLLVRLLETCEEACRLCGDECERHAAMHEHCRICAGACRRCERACKDARLTFSLSIQ